MITLITAHETTHTRSQVEKWLQDGLVTVNGNPVKANFKVTAGDVVTVTIPEVKPLKAVAEPIPLEIVYEDDQVIVVNKPQGMVVHPAPGHPDGTLVNGLLYHIKLPGINGVSAGIVHRIDKIQRLANGCKTEAAQLSVSAQLKAKTSIREYLALVHGTFKEDEGTIDAPLGRGPRDRKRQAVVADGRHAVTHFQVLERFTKLHLGKCILDTGRTHQIRVHMAYIHHPVAGDPLMAVSVPFLSWSVSSRCKTRLRASGHGKIINFYRAGTPNF